jgi:hypothetical protein
LVLFGKVGRKLASEKLGLVKKAINTSQRVLMIMIRKTNRGFKAFAAAFYDIHVEGYKPNLKLVPEYYRDAAPDIAMWLEIGQLTNMTTTRLSRFKLMSNERPLIETLSICGTSLMLIKEVANDG